MKDFKTTFKHSIFRQLKIREIYGRPKKIKYNHKIISKEELISQVAKGERNFPLGDFRLISQLEILEDYCGNFNFFGSILSNLSNSKLNNADFTQANLVKAEIFNVELINANLVGTDLTKAKLSFSNLTNANLAHANLKDAILALVKLVRANMSRSSLVRANFSQTDLTEANLYKADLRGSVLKEIIFIGSNLTKAILDGANLTKAILLNSNLIKSSLRKANLTQAILINTNLTQANLTKTNLHNANLRVANLSYANLSGANLNGANLDFAKFKGVIQSTFSAFESKKYCHRSDDLSLVNDAKEATVPILYLLKDGVLNDDQKIEMMGIENEIFKQPNIHQSQASLSLTSRSEVHKYLNELISKLIIPEEVKEFKKVLDEVIKFEMKILQQARDQERVGQTDEIGDQLKKLAMPSQEKMPSQNPTPSSASITKDIQKNIRENP